MIDPGTFVEWMQTLAAETKVWFATEVMTASSAKQLGALAFACLVARLTTSPARRVIKRTFAVVRADRQLVRLRTLAMSLAFPVLWLMMLWFAVWFTERNDQANEILRIAASLLSAWCGIRIVTSLVRDPFWSSAAAVVAWTIAALNILHLLGPVSAFLDNIAIAFGGTRISLYLLLKGAVLAVMLLWLAITSSAILQRRIEHVSGLTPSIRVLMHQISKFLFVTLAIVVALSSVGIDLSALALFSGAVGVGLGFGLQKVVSNLVSGIILLLDASIKPGDVIEVGGAGGTYGWVNSLGARYASVVTRDGTEYLIPNEDLITQQVVNWSFSNNFVRRRVPIGVHYKCDIELATKLIIESAVSTDRVLSVPEPQCLLRGFGDSSVDLELRFWIEDPQNGTANVQDAVLRKVWHAFHANGVEIPYPQRDLHIRSASGLHGLQKVPPGGV